MTSSIYKKVVQTSLEASLVASVSLKLLSVLVCTTALLIIFKNHISLQCPPHIPAFNPPVIAVCWNVAKYAGIISLSSFGLLAATFILSILFQKKLEPVQEASHACGERRT